MLLHSILFGYKSFCFAVFTVAEQCRSKRKKTHQKCWSQTKKENRGKEREINNEFGLHAVIHHWILFLRTIVSFKWQFLSEHRNWIPNIRRMKITTTNFRMIRMVKLKVIFFAYKFFSLFSAHCQRNFCRSLYQNVLNVHVSALAKMHYSYAPVHFYVCI